MSDTIDALPAPMVPQNCDVRGLAWMPLHGRVFGSRFYSLALRDPRAGLAGLKLWWEAWQQCPAGSLPDDDFDLARMADFGSDAKGWQKVKATALHGFVLCSDGRLYHPLICQEAMDAWDRRRKDRDRKAGQRAKKDGPVRDVSIGLSHGTGDGQDAGRAQDVRADKTRQDRTEEKKEPSPSAQGARARGGRLPLDWQPGTEDVAYAEGQGLDWRRVAENFRGYWLAKAGKEARKVDWSLTWQGWCRREAERAPRNRAPPQSATDRRLDEFTKAMEGWGYEQHDDFGADHGGGAGPLVDARAEPAECADNGQSRQSLLGYNAGRA